MKIFDWTEDSVVLLKRRRSEGANARKIADELGTTRCAVLGKEARLRRDEQGDAPVVEQSAPPRRPLTKRDRSVEVQFLDDVLACAPVEGTVLWKLKRCQCRWLERRGAPWVFCGAPATHKSYCAEHGARVYVKLDGKEKRA